MSRGRQEVLVTGMGAVTPFGVGVGPLRDGVNAGRSAIRWIESLGELNPEHYPVRYAGEVTGFDVDRLLTKHSEARLEKSVQMGLVAAQEALTQAGLLNDSHAPASVGPISVIAGSGHGACHETEGPYAGFFTRGPRAVRPTTITKCMFNSLSSHLSIHFGLTGANHVIASACSSGTAAIGLSTILIRDGFADIVLCGGADSPFTPMIFTCWTNLRVMARHTDPQRASRPFDAQRNGMVLAEGAAMVVLESRAKLPSDRPARGRWHRFSVTARRATPTTSPPRPSPARPPPCGSPGRRGSVERPRRLHQSAWHGDPSQRRVRGGGRRRGVWPARRADAGQFHQVDAGAFAGSQRGDRVCRLRRVDSPRIRASNHEL